MKKLLLIAGVTFATGISFGQTIFSEDFEGGLPGTWTQTTNASDGGWLAGTASSLSSTYFPISTTNSTNIVATNDDGCNCDKSADRLISPSINLSTAANPVMNVDVFFGEGSYNGVTETADIEVSTNGGSSWTNVASLTGDAAWHGETVDLSAYAGMSNVMISFLYGDGGDWEYGWGIDNFIVYDPVPNDARLDAVNIAPFAPVSTNTTLSVDVTNLGSNAITSLTIDWNDGSSHSSVISVNIPVGGSATVNHPTAVNYATAVEANIAVSITDVNSTTDGNPTNNDGAAVHHTLSQVVQKNVVFEEGTGTWCGWCVRGIVAMEYMDANHPNQFIGIAVHNGDPMTVTAYDNAANFSGFPGSNVDRVLLDQSVSNTDWENYFNARKDLNVPAGLNVTVSGTSSMTIDVDATFYTPYAAANYRLAVVMYENMVTGTGSSWNQANYYSSQSQNLDLIDLNGMNYKNLPNPILAADMVYDHVGRSLLGGYMGQTGTVPTTISDGTVASHTFNYTVPGTSTWSNMRAVAMLIDQNTGEIINAAVGEPAGAGINNLEEITMNVYPNPATDVVNVEFEAQDKDYNVEIIDLQGRVVMAGQYSNLSGKQLISVPVSEFDKGSYMVRISTAESSNIKYVTVQ